MQLDRDTLKEFFERGDFPTEAQFAHLIDSSPNFIDDSITGTDERVKISATDTLASYLNSKLAAGTGITFAVLNPGANEQLQISVTGGGSGDMLKSVYDTGDNGIVDNAELVNGLTVQTAVPVSALFTDTVYDDTAIQAAVALNTTHRGVVTGNPHLVLATEISDFDTEVGNNVDVAANTAKVTNATHTGDVIGSTALTIAAGAVDLAMLSATGTPSGSNFLRGDNTWAVPGGSGDMVLADAQTVSGAKTFEDTKFLLRNVADTFNGSFVNTNTADRIYTLQDAAGTLAFTSDITGTNSGTNTGDQTSIVGITGTKAQFDTAVTDGNFMYIGDAPTAHTHLLAAGATDVTATFSELNLLDLSGLTVGWVLSADTATTASWKAPTGGGSSSRIENTATTSYLEFGTSGADAFLTGHSTFTGNNIILQLEDNADVVAFSVNALGKTVLNSNGTYGVTTGLWFGIENSGIYEVSDGTLGIVAGGGIRLYVTGTVFQASSANQFLINHQTGLSATSPIYSFRNATGTGVGHAGTSQLSLIANSVEGLRLEEASSHVIQKVESHTGITANATQTQGQTPLLSSYNEISTVTTTNDVVTMPTATIGYKIIVVNNGANTLQIFPASGDNLGTGVDTSITLTAGSVGKYWAYDATNWKTI